MTTIAENNIRAMEMLAEELRQELNEAIAEYEEAVEHPEFYQMELAKKLMDEAQKRYEECLDEIERERMWAEC